MSTSMLCTDHLHMRRRAYANMKERVNSKATLKVPLSALLPLVPSILHQDLRSSRYVADRTDAIVIQSDEARKQSANVESCYEKLFRAVEESARNVIPGETSVEQRDRVRDLYVFCLRLSIRTLVANNAKGKKPRRRHESRLKRCIAQRRAIVGIVNTMIDLSILDIIHVNSKLVNAMLSKL
jgi:hypothetical protein